MDNRSVKNVVIFISGTGTNAEKILDAVQIKYLAKYNFIVFTDKLNSNAKFIARKYRCIYLHNYLEEFYKKHNKTRTSILQKDGFHIRSLWTESVKNN